MPEDRPGVQNKGLLVSAVVVGLLVVAMYNYQINQVRKAGRGESVEVLAFARAHDAGEQIKEHSFSRVKMDLDFIEGLGDVVNLRDDKLTDVVGQGQKLQMAVPSGRFLRWGHLQGYKGDPPSANIRKGMEFFPLGIEPRLSPGTMLNIGDHVSLMGIFTTKSGRGTYRIMEHVRVLSIGGVTGRGLATRTGGSRTSGTSQRTYSSLGIEITPDTARRLNNVLTRLEGPLHVSVASRGSDIIGDGKPKIHPELRDLPALGEGPRVR